MRRRTKLRMYASKKLQPQTVDGVDPVDRVDVVDTFERGYRQPGLRLLCPLGHSIHYLRLKPFICLHSCAFAVLHASAMPP
jgi:hypothetical protein